MDAPRFTVDTHLFRELGELLVGRDSTALVELIKNAYDADARLVTVHGERLSDPQHARITIKDDGIGMTEELFRSGFLRVASRLKEKGSRQSLRYKRRFTGAKGIGRLAAHKLARSIRIYSAPGPELHNGRVAVDATIDWDIVEKFQTLEDVPPRWTQSERTRFFAEVQTFQPPKILVDPPKSIVNTPLLFETPIVYDTASNDPGFEVELTRRAVLSECFNSYA